MNEEAYNQNIDKMEKIELYLRNQLMGPHKGEYEVLDKSPRHYYSTGMLFPHEPNVVDDWDEDDSALDTVDAEIHSLTGKIAPSAMGVEVRLPKDSVDVLITISYSLYIKTDEVGQGSWERRTFNEEFPLSYCELNSYQNKDLVEIKGCYIRFLRKSYEATDSLKVYLVNYPQKNEFQFDNIIYQPEIQISCKEGFVEFKNEPHKLLCEEDRMLMMRFRKHKKYAAAYGCSAQWAQSTAICDEVRTTFFPTYEVNGLNFDVSTSRETLNAHYLSFGLEENPAKVINSLRDFADGYEKWIKNQKLESESDPSLKMFEAEAQRSLYNCKIIKKRMVSGIDLIEKNPDAMKAFIEANRTMLVQGISKLNEGNKLNLDDSPLTFFSEFNAHYFWRPFQLAFLLISIDPTINKESVYRNDSVDLIWFPTGGGKTEAYFGVIAFSLLYNRVIAPTKEMGTCVISRYTLRLLSAQQFERAAILICALELLRSANPKCFGSQRFSIGFWVGASTTPNKIASSNPEEKRRSNYAELLLDDLLNESEPRNNSPFPIIKCPSCGTDLLPDSREDDIEKYGYKISEDKRKLQIKCLRKECLFHRDEIPVYFVDAQIYDEQPTVLLGTVDKFAQLVQSNESGLLLNGQDGKVDPPFLIIQDELHLISGPLGSIVGVYEAAIEALCSKDRAKPYMISSTATVRRADLQCNALYCRKAMQFPPPGLDEADSYFCKKNERLNRKYLGILTPNVSKMTGMVRAHAALLQSIQEMSNEYRSTDAYWTLVSYHNNLRDLGAATTAAADDIDARLKVIAKSKANVRELTDDHFIDLYNERKGNELTSILNRLNSKIDDDDPYSLLLATSIIAVGVDVSRLGLMLINGQPNSTADYIQASSRVGRHPEMPGLVVTHYGGMKSRDRSYYENFLSYHSSLYASVEPTSVTPFSKPTLDKALHAIMIILARYLSKEHRQNDSAESLLEDRVTIDSIRKIILERVKSSNPDHRTKLERELDFKFEEWSTWASSHHSLLYNEPRQRDRTNREFQYLTHAASSRAPDVGWETMDSMRHVDLNCSVFIHQSKVRGV